MPPRGQRPHPTVAIAKPTARQTKRAISDSPRCVGSHSPPVYALITKAFHRQMMLSVERFFLLLSAKLQNDTIYKNRHGLPNGYQPEKPIKRRLNLLYLIVDNLLACNLYSTYNETSSYCPFHLAKLKLLILNLKSHTSPLSNFTLIVNCCEFGIFFKNHSSPCNIHIEL